MLKLIIGNKNYSSWSMRAWVLMRQAGIAFEETLVRFDSFDADSAFKRQLAGLSPTGKVPVLEALVDAAEWEAREPATAELATHGCGRELFASFRERVGSAETGASVLFVTHSIAEAVFLSDRVGVLSRRPGSLVGIEDVLLERPRRPELEDDPAFFAIETRLRRLLHEGNALP